MEVGEEERGKRRERERGFQSKILNSVHDSRQESQLCLLGLNACILDTMVVKASSRETSSLTGKQ